MKTNKLFIAALFGIATLGFQSCMGQKVNVPANVKTAIHKTYPQVKHFTWEKENGNFEGNWKVKGKDHSALFTPDGHFVGSETEINPSKLPATAKEYVEKLGESKIKEASLNKDANGTITYEADIEDGTLLFDASGHFAKKEMSEENNEKGESHEEQDED